MLKRALIAVVLALLASQAMAQGGPGGPGPVPDPWTINGLVIFYNKGSVNSGSSSLGNTGIGTFNAQNGYYINGVLVDTITSVTSPLTFSGAMLSCPTCLTTTGSFANPTAKVGLSAVNGSDTTAMRSDASPPLDQTISPIWTGTHTFTNSLLRLLGSSTGYTTFTSANGGASNFTLTFPAVTDTLAVLGTAQTWTALQQFNDGDFALKGSASGTLVQHAAAAAGSSVLTWPAGTTDFTATGSAHYVVRQSSAGAALTVGQLACSDLSDSVSGCSGTASSITVGNPVIGGTNSYLLGISSGGNLASQQFATLAQGGLGGDQSAAAANTVPVFPGSGGAAVPTTLASIFASPSPIGGTTPAAGAFNGLTATGSFTATGLVTNADLAGSIAASKLVGTDIATVGTLTAGIASTGFTIQASNVTYTGTVPAANLPVVANASGSPSATFGVMKADGTTIQCSSGVCSAVGAVASAVTIGTTAVNSASGSNQLLTTGTVVGGAGTLANVASTAVVFGTGTLNLSGNLATTGAFNPTFAIGASVTYTFPGAAATLASLNIPDQPLSGGANVTTLVQSAGTLAMDCGARPLQMIPNVGAFNLTAPTADGSCILQVVNMNGAGAITFVNWSHTTPVGTFATADTSNSTVTVTSASPGIVSWTGHGLVAGTIVYFTNSGGALPTGFSAATQYFVCKGATLLTNSFAVATSYANAIAGICVNTSSTGTGTQTAHQASVYSLSVEVVDGLPTGLWAQQQ